MFWALILIAGLIVVGVCTLGRSKSMPVNSPAVTAKTSNVQRSLLSKLVTLKNYGLAHLADVVKNVWTNDKAALEQMALIEAEHLAQGGPALVVQDLEAAFGKMLLAKLADAAEAQKLLQLVQTTLGTNHPLLTQFAQGVLGVQPPAASSSQPAA